MSSQVELVCARCTWKGNANWSGVDKRIEEHAWGESTSGCTPADVELVDDLVSHTRGEVTKAPSVSAIRTHAQDSNTMDLEQQWARGLQELTRDEKRAWDALGAETRAGVWVMSAAPFSCESVWAPAPESASNTWAYGVKTSNEGWRLYGQVNEAIQDSLASTPQGTMPYLYDLAVLQGDTLPPPRIGSRLHIMEGGVCVEVVVQDMDACGVTVSSPIGGGLHQLTWLALAEARAQGIGVRRGVA